MSETADSPQNGVTTPPYDPLLNKLYNSQRPPVELVPGVGLSAVVNAAWLPNDAKAMLSESWIPVAEEPEEPTPDEEPGPPPLSFDPAAAEYNVMAKRLSRSLPLWDWNSLTIKVKELEKDIEKEKDDKMKEAKNNQLEEARANLAETEAQLADLRASFAEEPISLVPWMQTLFALADAGLSTFDVSGRFYPYTNLRALFSSENNSSFFEGPETVLGAFKRRYERERGQGRIQLLMKLVPNHFQDGYVPEEVVEKMVERMRSSLFGAEPPEALDLVQLHWHDVHVGGAI